MTITINGRHIPSQVSRLRTFGEPSSYFGERSHYWGPSKLTDLPGRAASSCLRDRDQDPRAQIRETGDLTDTTYNLPLYISHPSRAVREGVDGSSSLQLMVGVCLRLPRLPYYVVQLCYVMIGPRLQFDRGGCLWQKEYLGFFKAPVPGICSYSDKTWIGLLLYSRTVFLTYSLESEAQHHFPFALELNHQHHPRGLHMQGLVSLFASFLGPKLCRVRRCGSALQTETALCL
jgi:hypothetical protein